MTSSVIKIPPEAIPSAETLTVESAAASNRKLLISATFDVPVKPLESVTWSPVAQVVISSFAEEVRAPMLPLAPPPALVAKPISPVVSLTRA